MHSSGFDTRPFIFKAFLREGDALVSLCSIWELVLMPRRKSCEHRYKPLIPQHLSAFLSSLRRLLCELILP